MGKKTKNVASGNAKVGTQIGSHNVVKDNATVGAQISGCRYHDGRGWFWKNDARHCSYCGGPL